MSVTEGGTTTVRKSTWDGRLLASELDSDGTLYRYTHGPDGRPLALARTSPGESEEVFSYHTDSLGSVVAITDGAGSVVARYRYGAYGEVLLATGSDAALAMRNPLRYRGYYHDAHSGLYYLPARSYDPVTCRFLSPDPAPAQAGDPLSLNRHSYCMGDPVNFSDPTGETVDVDGDGRLDREDTVSENYIRTPVTSPLKVLRRQNMVTAVAQADRLRAEQMAHVAGGGGRKEGLDYATDYNFTWVFATKGALSFGVTGGAIVNHRAGCSEGEGHAYLGLAFAAKPSKPSVSVMVTPSLVDPDYRYMELAGGIKGRGLAVGFKSNDPEDAVSDPYVQFGMSSPGAAATWFYVFK